MEPPTKRPRLGISPFNNDQDEIDGDELNLQPEQVNALRDPGYQLERSRAVAANRLKSAFERIFEKYGKDFTGIGDEVNLETGEVEVDNGHIQSLEDAIVGDEDEEDDADDSDSMEEEERLLQGKPSNEKRLSSIGESGSSPLKSLIQPLGNPQPWPADPPRISSMFGPPRPPFGCFSTVHEIPSGMDSLVDPAWKAPQLPVVETYVDPAWRAPDLPPPKSATPRLPMLKKKLPTAGNLDEEDDDVLSGASTTPMTKLKGSVTAKRMKKLSPSHTQGSDPGINGAVSKLTPKQKESNTPKSMESAGKTRPAVKNANTKPAVRPDPVSGSKPMECKQKKAKQQMRTNPGATKQLVAVKSEKSTNILPKKRKEPGGIPGPELYIDISSGKAITSKPKDQKLIVDIVVRSKIDTTLYQTIPTDPSHDQAAVTSAEGQKEDSSPRVVDVSEARGVTEEDMGKQQRTQKSAGQEVYKRNVVDSSFAFSDDEEPALPKPRIAKRHPGRPKKQKTSVLQIDAPTVSRPQVVITENGADSALNVDSGAFEARAEERDEIEYRNSSKKDEAPEPVAEDVYARNTIDPGFAFSDEEHSTLPKARVKAGAPQTKKTPQKLVSIDEPAPADAPAPTTVEAPLTSSEPNNEELTVPQASANEQSALDETNELHTLETVTEDVANVQNPENSPKEWADDEAGVSTVENDAPLVPAESSRSPLAPEPDLETIEPPAESDAAELPERTPHTGSPGPSLEEKELPAETDTVQQSESTSQIGSSEPVPNEIVEHYPVRLLQMKPRRKRKISMATTEESMPSPTGPEEDKPTATFITAPSKRLKRSRLSYSVAVSDLVDQQEEQTVQLDPEPVKINDITIPETSPPPPPPPEQTAIPERAPMPVGLTVPESSPLLQPAFNSSLMGIVDDFVQLDDAPPPEPENDMNLDTSPSHPTPMPDLPSPELGEDATVPETSPLPYSSPSKAVKAAVKKPKPKAKPPSQPSTPVNRKEKEKQKTKDKPRVSESPAPSTLSKRKGLLSLIPDGNDDDEDENELETDEQLSLTPRPRYYTPPSVRQSIGVVNQQDTGSKHTSLTAPLLRMKLLSSSKKGGGGIRNIPKTPSHGQGRRRTLMAPVISNNENVKSGQGRGLLSSSSTSRMYFSADRRAPSSSSGRGAGGTSSGGVKRRRRSSGAVAVAGSGARQVANLRIPKFVKPSKQDEEGEMVLTPGGTRRRCGEDGFHCDRDFCFVCL